MWWASLEKGARKFMASARLLVTVNEPTPRWQGHRVEGGGPQDDMVSMKEVQEAVHGIRVIEKARFCCRAAR